MSLHPVKREAFMNRRSNGNCGGHATLLINICRKLLFLHITPNRPAKPIHEMLSRVRKLSIFQKNFTKRHKITINVVGNNSSSDLAMGQNDY